MTLTRVAFEVTRRCNLNCKHCLRDEADGPQDLPLSLIERVMTQAKEKYGIQLTAFTGGEPLMYPRLEELFDLVDDMGFSFSFVTNGHLVPKRLGLLTRPETRRRLTHVAVSLDGPDAETHDHIRGEGAFKKAVVAIAALKAQGFPVHVKYSVAKHNFDQLERAALQAAHLGAARIELAHVHPTPENVKAGLILTPDEMRKVESEVYRLSEELKMMVTMTSGIYVGQGFFSCAALAMFEMYVDYKGRLCLCCQLPGLKGRDPGKIEGDVIADLAETDLWDAHKKLVSVISGLQKKRVDMIAKGELDMTDHFQCVSCARHFGKMDWINELPDNPWAKPKRDEKP